MTQYYFAYGSNLCTADWRDWCERNGFESSGLSPVCTAYLPDHKLHFSHFSSSRGGGALNVLHSVGHVVEGVLMAADQDAWRALDRKEGAPHVYEAVEMTVLDANGSQYSATVYVLKPERVKAFVRPTAEYVSIVKRGLNEFDLSTNALELAASSREPRPLASAVFTYGTLMRGESRFSCMEQFNLRATLLGAISGRLVDLGDYPGLLPFRDAYCRECVEGDFIRVADIGETLAELDRIEGFEGYCPESLYIRRLTSVAVGGRLRWAWIYEYNLHVEPNTTVIGSGSWRKHTGVETKFLHRIAQAHAAHLERQDLMGRFMELSSRSRKPSSSPELIRELADALGAGTIDERRLAQASGNWLAGAV